MDTNSDHAAADPFDHMAAGSPDRHCEIPDLISHAKHLINSERPMAALEKLTDALRIIGGEKLIMRSLQTARENYWDAQDDAQLPEQPSSDPISALTNLFQQCVMSTVPARDSDPRAMLPERYHHLLENSLASDRHGSDFVESAAAHRSSVVCSSCGAIVKESRMDAHAAYWCDSLDS
eukprot:TRINITY_DN9078_c0_g1_i2.p1 TRINITY_DN9078_c0_g1~~TRINITY_DN9078_c0_g1_i2.p1  ORF type:complete len:178 (+),score=29.48 TRINITY_DN9078_c0_g1_i2:367-900(+)